MNFLKILNSFIPLNAHKNPEKQRKASKRVPNEKVISPVRKSREHKELKDAKSNRSPLRQTNPIIVMRSAYHRFNTGRNPEPIKPLQSCPSVHNPSEVNEGISSRAQFQSGYREDLEKAAYKLGKLKMSLGLHEGTTVQMLQEYLEQNLNSSSPPRPLWELLGHDQADETPPPFVLRDYFEPKRQKFTLKNLSDLKQRKQRKRDERQKCSPDQKMLSEPFPENTQQLAVLVAPPVHCKISPDTSKSLLSIININENHPEVLSKSNVSYCSSIDLMGEHIGRSTETMVEWSNSSSEDEMQSDVTRKIKLQIGTTKKKTKGFGDAIRSSAKGLRLNDPEWFGRSLVEHRSHVNKIAILDNHFEPKRQKLTLKNLSDRKQRKRNEMQKRSSDQKMLSEPFTESTHQLAVPVSPPRTSKSILSIVNINENPPQVFSESNVSCCSLDIDLMGRIGRSEDTMVEWSNSSSEDEMQSDATSKIKLRSDVIKQKNELLGVAIRSSAKGLRLNDPKWFRRSLTEHRSHVNKIAILDNCGIKKM